MDKTKSFMDIFKKMLDNIADNTNDVLREKYGWHFVAMNTTYALIYLFVLGNYENTQHGLYVVAVVYIVFVLASKIY